MVENLVLPNNSHEARWPSSWVGQSMAPLALPLVHHVGSMHTMFGVIRVLGGLPYCPDPTSGIFR